MITFNCAKCGQKIIVAEEHAGKQARCPSCQIVVDIPTQDQPTTQRTDVSHATEAEHALPFPAAQIDGAVDRLRQSLGVSLFNKAETFGYLLGSYGLIVLAALVVVAAIVRINVEGFAWGVPPTWTLLAYAVGLIVCQYVVGKVRRASLKVISSSPTKTSSTNIMDCSAVLLLLGAVVAFPVFIFLGVESDDTVLALVLTLVGAIIACILFLSACLALNPKGVNVTVDPRESAGGEAIGLLSFELKFLLRIAPLILGGLAILWAVGLLLIIYKSADAESGIPFIMFIDASSTMAFGFTASFFGMYLLCLFYHLLVDAIVALFQIRENTRSRG